MTILLYFHFGTFRNFKHYYLFFIKGTMKSYFPKAVSYNRFVELESRVFFQLMFSLNPSLILNIFFHQFLWSLQLLTS